MASGFFQGGFAKGIASGREQENARGQLMLRSELGRRQLSLEEQQAAEDQKKQQSIMIRQRISDSVTNISEAAQALRESGKTPHEILNVLRGHIDSAADLLSTAGGNGEILKERLIAQASQPGEPKEDPLGKVKTDIEGKRLLMQELIGQGVDEATARNTAFGIKEGKEGKAGGNVTTAQKNELGKAEVAVGSLDKELGELDKLIQKEGSSLPFSEAAALSTSKRRNIQLQLKELYNLGVLNGPDLALMDSLIPNPNWELGIKSTGSGVGVNIPANIKNRAKVQIAELRKQMKTLLDAKRKTYGGEAGTVNEADTPPEGVDPETWQFMTPEERALWQ